MAKSWTFQNPSRNKIMGKRWNSGSKNGTLNTVSETEKEWPYSSWTSIIPYLNGSCTLMPGKGSSGEIQWSQIDSDTLVYALPINKQGMWLLEIWLALLFLCGPQRLASCCSCIEPWGAWRWSPATGGLLLPHLPHLYLHPGTWPLQSLECYSPQLFKGS